jgi:hypothetical protein
MEYLSDVVEPLVVKVDLHAKVVFLYWNNLRIACIAGMSKAIKKKEFMFVKRV